MNIRSLRRFTLTFKSVGSNKSLMILLTDLLAGLSLYTLILIKLNANSFLLTNSFFVAPSSSLYMSASCVTHSAASIICPTKEVPSKNTCNARRNQGSSYRYTRYCVVFFLVVTKIFFSLTSNKKASRLPAMKSYPEYKRLKYTEFWKLIIFVW